MRNISFEVYEQGQQLFYKNEKTNFAYLILHGQIGFYNDRMRKKYEKDFVKLSPEAQSLLHALKAQKEFESVKEACIKRGLQLGGKEVEAIQQQILVSKRRNNNLSIAEIQSIRRYLVGSSVLGDLLGELSMIHKEDPNKNRRNLTGICTSEFAVLVKMNDICFNILFKEKLRRDFDVLAKFVFESVPGMSKFYTINRLMSRAPFIIKQHVVSKGEFIIKEGEESDSIYIVLQGSCSLIKTFNPVAFTSFKAPNTSVTVLGLNKGDIFGEDKLLFKRTNRLSVKVDSVKLTYLAISNQNFEKTFLKILPDLVSYFK